MELRRQRRLIRGEVGRQLQRIKQDSEYAAGVMELEIQRYITREAGRKLPNVLQDIVVEYVFDDDKFREANQKEKDFEECRNCGRTYEIEEGDHDLRLQYHITMLRLDIPIVKEFCDDPTHRHYPFESWRDCQTRKFKRHMRENQRDLITVWLCDSECVTAMGGWPTLGSIRVIEEIEQAAIISEEKYWELVYTTFMILIVNQTSEGPWPFELLGTNYQETVITLISTSIVGQWTDHFSVCRALGWEHLPGTHLVKEWPLAMLRMTPLLSHDDNDNDDMDTRL
jgi:hypothetical protein